MQSLDSPGFPILGAIAPTNFDFDTPYCADDDGFPDDTQNFRVFGDRISYEGRRDIDESQVTSIFRDVSGNWVYELALNGCRDLFFDDENLFVAEADGSGYRAYEWCDPPLASVELLLVSDRSASGVRLISAADGVIRDTFNDLDGGPLAYPNGVAVDADRRF